MKNILIILTGGTIESVNNGNGLQPIVTDEIKSYFKRKNATFTFLRPFSLDSCNVGKNEWIILGDIINEKINNFDAFIITHGTDTLSFTATALSLMLKNIKKQVVITGSMLPLDTPNSDAENNISFAIDCSLIDDLNGVFVAFGNELMYGDACTKKSTDDMNAFESINKKCITTGEKIISSGDYQYSNKFNSDVFLLKLYPSMECSVLDILVKLGYKKLLIEAFGKGGMQEDVLNKILLLSQNGMDIFITTQCHYKNTDCSLYAVSKKLADNGIIEFKDKTTEFALISLMMEK